MALARLKRVLQSQYAVRLQSDQRLVNRVRAKITRRAQEFALKGKPSPPSKTPTVVSLVQAQQQWQIRAIDLLHKLGRLTTPNWVNMAQLSASWATRRYFWAIADGNGGQQDFRLSADARRIDFHQKTLLSDEFGMGIAGLLLEQIFNAPSFVDVSVALNDPTVYQNVQRIGDTEPDYLMWGEDPVSPYYVVECKGCQTNSSTSMDQLRRGLEQVPSLAFGIGARAVVTLVVATCMEVDRTTVYVVDPPDDDSKNSHPPDDAPTGKVSDRIGRRKWRITNLEAFEKRIRLARESELLWWAGQFGKAMDRDKYLVPREHLLVLPDFELETRKTEAGSYRGLSWPLFPELGRQNLRLFTGVEEELLARTLEASSAVKEAAESVRHRVAKRGLDLESPYESLSANGTCMMVDGLA